MNGKDIELSRRRVLGGIATVGAASAAAGAGTFALFSDTEESNDNTLTAGTLDLTLDGTSDLGFTASHIKPTDNDTGSTVLTNEGNIDGDLTVSITDVTMDDESTPESATDTGTTLADQLEIQLWIDTAQNDSYDSSDDYRLNTSGNVDSNSLEYNSVTDYLDSGEQSWSTPVTLGSDVTFNIDWQLPDRTDNNDVQGDSISIDFEFELVQSDTT